MSDNFYRAFEEKHRGSRELIISRLRAYLPFISPLKEIYPVAPATDLGCGRGEWIELLMLEGFLPHGVDQDEGMLQGCLDRNLPAKKGDVIEYLSTLSDSSQTIVSAFHVVEHITFDQLRTLVSEALRVLKPGGLLIIETPNPENIAVATRNFYLDPSHLRPIPPDLLSFLPEYYNFSRTKIIRLQESEALVENLTPKLNDVFEGVSPDYAVIAQKHASNVVLEKFDQVFAQGYGLDLRTLTERYDAAIVSRIQKVEALALEANVKAKQAELQSSNYLLELHAVYASRSWRITAPFRYLFHQIRSLEVYQHKFCVNMNTRKIIWKTLDSAQKILILKKIGMALLKRIGLLNYIKSFYFRHRHKELGLSNSLYNSEQGAVLGLNVLPINPTVPDTMLLPEQSAQPLRWIRFTGHIEGHYSLAIVNRGLVGALDDINSHCISLIPYHGKPYEKLPVFTSPDDNILNSILRRNIPKLEEENSISIVHHYPFITDPNRAGIRGMIFFWEETSVPIDIINHINKSFDVVWVAASSVKKALINSGCCPQVFVIPIGIDHLISSETTPLDMPAITKEGRLRFLHVSSVFERKGADILLKAYLKAFTAEDNVELYIKTFPNPHNKIHEQLSQLIQGLDRPARVIIDEEELNDSEMLKLYRSSHAMILPTRGEGFNLPAAEAMAMGLPLVVTGYGAHIDFSTESTAILLGYSFSKSRSHLCASDACWIEPNVNDLAEKLKNVKSMIQRQDSSLEIKRQNGLNHVRKVYTWENAARSLMKSIGYLQSIPCNSFDRMHIAYVGPWATSCGIAEYGQSLMTNFLNNKLIQVDIYRDDRPLNCDLEDMPSWTITANDNFSLKKVLDIIASSDAQVVFLQHHPAFFSLSNSLCQQLMSLKELGKLIFIEFHSTEPLLHEFKPTMQSIDILKNFDRLIVHKTEDLNNFLQLGLVDNVMMLPLGAIQPLETKASHINRAVIGIPDDALVIGSFGFALPHKGIDTLVRVVAHMLSESERDIHLLAVNSILDKRSEDYVEFCKKLARDLGIEKNIHFMTDYLPINICQNYLSLADYIIYPYIDTRESASAAITIGLSTLKPVLCSPLQIFSDVENVAWTMKGSGLKDIVQSIKLLEKENDKVANLIEQQKKWIHDRDWNVLSTRLEYVMRSLMREADLKNSLA